jgi:Glycosyl hydrolase family 81 N-terminal domain
MVDERRNSRNNNEKRTPRSQLHYFYGTTSNAATETVVTSTVKGITGRYQQGDNNGVPNESDSLVGEELISTDNEGEDNTVGLLVKGSAHHHNHQQHPTINRNASTFPSSSSSSSSCGMCSVVLFLLVACGVTMAMVYHFVPHDTSSPMMQTFTMPFSQVDRAQFGDPVEDFIDMTLFHPNLMAPPGSQHAFVFPFPTGAFWTNLIVPSPQGEQLSYPIAVYPYAYRWSATTLQVSYPTGHRVVDHHTIQDTFAPDLKLSTVEDVTTRHVTKFDPLSVTLQFMSTSDSQWETTLVQGSPYITLRYLKSTPVIAPLSIFSKVQCPGDADKNFSDWLEETSIISSSSSGKVLGNTRRRLFGVCSIDVRSYLLGRVVYYNGGGLLMESLQYLFLSLSCRFYMIGF